MRSRIDKYVLDADGNPRPERNLLAWARWFENFENRRVRQDTLPNGVIVSTVFLGLDHNFLGQAPPVLWESWLRGGPYHDTMWRYNSKEKALKGHAALVAMAQEEWNLDEMLGEMPRRLHTEEETETKCEKPSKPPGKSAPE